MISLVPLQAGDAGTAQTVTALRGVVDAAQLDPGLRAAVVEILHGVPSREPRLDLSTLLQFVRDRVRYQADPVDVEYVQSPRRMLDAIQRSGRTAGDCDDMAGLLAALAEAAGYPTRFRVQGPPGDDYQHIIVEAQEPAGAWVALDPTRRSGGLGVAPATVGGREAREMLGQTWDTSLDVETDIQAAAPTGYDTTLYDAGGGYLVGSDQYVAGGGIPDLFVSLPAPIPAASSAPATGGGDIGSFFSDLFKGVSQAAPSVLGILERTGIYKPVAGYTPTGAPIYAPAVAPVGGLYGAGYSALTQVGPLGLSMGTWLLLAGGGLLVLTMRGKRGR